MKIIYYKLLFFLFFFILSTLCFSQKTLKINSLEEKLKTEKSNSGIVFLSLELSKLYSNEDIEKSMSYAQKALAISIDSKSDKDQINSLNQVGKINMLNNDYDLALEAFINALNINKRISDLKETAISNLLIGDVYREIGDVKRSRNQYEQALQIGMKTKNLIVQSLSNLSLGKLEGKIGNENISLQYFILSNEQIELTNNTGLKGEVSYNLGKAYIKSNNLSAANQVLIQSLKYYEKANDLENQTMLCFEVGNLYEKLEDHDNSLLYLKNSLGLAEKIGYKKYIKKGYENISKVYESKGDFRRAYEFLQYYSAIKDVREINALETQLELAKKNQKLLLLEEEEKRKKELSNIRFLFALVVLIILLLFSIFMIYAYRQKSAINIDLKAATEQANKSRQEKEDFFAYTSHEIRTPLNAVVGMTQLLSGTNLNEKQQHYLKTINSSANNILFLVNDILDLAKIEKGAIQLEVIPFSLIELINDISDSLAFKTRMKNIELKSSIDLEIPDLILGDPVRINQIILNLADNAVKFTDKGHVHIKLSLKEKLNDSVVILFTVKDSGVGIKKAKLETIFDSFKQESSETTRQYGGTGLGLAITKELVQLMGSEIKVESETGKGSSFYFSLKMKTAKNNSKENIATKITPDTSLSNVSILLVDDNQLNRDVFIDLMGDSKNKVKIDIAQDGAIAINKLKKNNYDIILMDLQMPNMDGYEATQYIRKKFPENKNQIPIVAMTAHVIDGVAEKCMALGMNDCVSKPINTVHLSNIINKLLKRTSKSIIEDLSDEETDENKYNIIDLSMIKKISKGDNKKIIKYIDIYLKNIPVDVKKMKLALKDLNYPEISNVAHKLKGNIGYMGLNDLVLDLDKLENLIKNDGNSNEIAIIVSEVESIIALSIDELKSYKNNA